jgi:SprT protein
MSSANHASLHLRAKGHGSSPLTEFLSPVMFPSLAGIDPVLTQSAKSWLVQLGCHPAADRIQVVWNPRLQTTAGTACVYTTRIELNPRLNQIGDVQIQRTLRHEVAHIIAHARAGKRAHRLQTHGPEWRLACSELGIAGEPAYHDLPFERRTLARKYTYECPHCHLIVHRVRKFARYTACYRCCKNLNHGRYNSKFQFRMLESRVAADLASCQGH